MIDSKNDFLFLTFRTEDMSLKCIGILIFLSGLYSAFYPYYIYAQISVPGKTAKELNNDAAGMLSLNNFEWASERAREAMMVARIKAGTESPEEGRSLFILGKISVAQKKLARAIYFFERAITIQEKFKYHDPVSLAETYDAMTTIYMELKNLDKAKEYAEKNVDIREMAVATQDVRKNIIKTLPEKVIKVTNPNQTARALDNLAAIYYLKKDFTKAKLYFERALAHRKSFLPADSLELAKSMENLADVELRLKNSKEATLLFEDALRIRKTDLEKEPLPHIVTLEKVARLYMSEGAYAEAKICYELSLNLKTKVYGDKHIELASNLDNLSTIHRLLKEYSEAKPFARRSLALRQELLGATHPDVADSLDRLAIVYDYQGRFVKSEPLYRAALDIRKNKYGEAHESVAVSYNNLARVLHQQKRYEDAEPLYRKALSIWEKTLGQNHPTSAVAYGHLGELYAALGSNEQADTAFKQAISILESHFDQDDYKVKRAKRNLEAFHKKNEEKKKPADYIEPELFKHTIGIEEPKAK